jgi:hypothetical protein
MMTGGDIKCMDMCRNDMVSFLVNDQLTVFWLCAFCLYQSIMRMTKVKYPKCI